MFSLSNFSLAFSTFTTAMIAGLFYSYSCSVNPGLARLTDANYIATMQSINTAIINPVFLFSFLGTLFLLPLSTYLVFQEGISNCFWLLSGATLLYWTGSFGVTIFGNVPLNEALASFDLSTASEHLIAEQRAKFEQPWNRLHLIRTIASVLSLILAISACLARR